VLIYECSIIYVYYDNVKSSFLVPSHLRGSVNGSRHQKGQLVCWTWPLRHPNLQCCPKWKPCWETGTVNWGTYDKRWNTTSKWYSGFIRKRKMRGTGNYGGSKQWVKIGSKQPHKSRWSWNRCSWCRRTRYILRNLIYWCAK